MKQGRVSTIMEDVSLKEARLFQSLTRLFHPVVDDAPLESAEAFSALYERNYRSVYRYLYGLRGGPAEDVEDLTADTFARAWKSRRSFAGDPHSAGTGWLQRLPGEQREMLVLRYLLDWRITQISEYLEIPENTVSVTIRRTLARLQRDWPQVKE